MALSLYFHKASETRQGVSFSAHWQDAVKTLKKQTADGFAPGDVKVEKRAIVKGTRKYRIDRGRVTSMAATY